MISIPACKSFAENAGEHVEQGAKELGKQVESGAKALADSIAKLEHIDPAALHRLMNEKSKLESDLRAVQAAYNGWSGSGAIDLPSKQVWFRVPRIRGKFMLTVQVDEQQTALTTVVFGTPADLPSLPYDEGGVSHQLLWLPIRNVMEPGLEAERGGPGADKDVRAGNAERRLGPDRMTWLRVEMQRALGVLTANCGLNWGVDANRIALHNHLGGTGVHVVDVVITPLDAPSDGSWQIRLEVVAKPDGRPEELVCVAEADSTQHKDHKLGTALESIRFRMRVRS